MARFSHSLFLLCLLLLSGCVVSSDAYFQQIQSLGYIPFKFPLAGIGTGAMIRGTPDNFIIMGPPTHCFPDQVNGNPTNLRWFSDASLPTTHYSGTMNFDMNLNTIAQAGSPLMDFKIDLHKATTVDVEYDGATVQMFDELSLQDFFHSGMTASCVDAVQKYNFIFDGLQVQRMTFVFHDQFSGKIKLTDGNLSEIVDIAAGVDWDIEQDYTLVVKTPKFIGYHLGKLTPPDDGLVNWVAFDVKNGDWNWTNLNGDPNH